jgi:hypothetical protein
MSIDSHPIFLVVSTPTLLTLVPLYSYRRRLEGLILFPPAHVREEAVRISQLKSPLRLKNSLNNKVGRVTL